MPIQISKVDVWAVEIPDSPGGLAEVLEALAGAGAKLECVIGRRQPDKPGTGVAFLYPVRGRKVQAAAQQAGVKPAGNIATLRVEGPDKAGLGAKMLRAIAQTQVNLRGISAATVGNKFVAYFGFDNAADAAKASRALKSVR